MDLELGSKILLGLAIWALVGSVAALVLGRAIRFGNPLPDEAKIEPTLEEKIYLGVEGSADRRYAQDPPARMIKTTTF